MTLLRRLAAPIVALAVALPLGLAASPAQADPARCGVPAAGRPAQTASPASVDLDPGAVRRAVDQLSVRGRLSVQVFRHGCLVAGDPVNPVTEHVPNNVWSVTKSVTSLLTGIAVGDGKLGLDDPIGRYLPVGTGWGDAAHRAITVRQLLTQTSGMAEAIFSEAATTGLDPSLAREALAQPIVHTPGTHFEYSQLGPALLAYVVQRAVGQDLRAFAQARLFGPIGIEPGSYVWLTDRSGTAYGYSNLFLTPTQLARLGLLMSDQGRWGARQVVPAAYVREVSRPTATNGCYGLLFWTNAGSPCTGANVPSAQTLPHRAIESAPADTYEMNGTGQQLVIMVPSLDITVVTTGYFGDTFPDPSILLGATPGDLQYDFFRTLMSGVRDVAVPDPGPYRGERIQLDADPRNYLDPAVLARDLAPSANCNVVACSPQ